MAFRIIDGFDSYNGAGTATGVTSRWTDSSTGGTRSIISGRFGGQALRMTDGSGSTGLIRRPTGVAHSTFSIGLAMRAFNRDLLGNSQPLIQLESGGALQLALHLQGGTTGTVRVHRGLNATPLLFTSGDVWSESTWFYIEFYGLLDQVAGWFEIYVNGLFLGRYDGDTCALAGSTMNGVALNMPDHTNSGNTMDYDDFFLADVATRFGECRVETLRPTADTVQKQFTPSTAGTNFDDVDDVVISSTDYVESGTVGDLDLYELGDLSSVPTTIHAVGTIVSAWNSDVTSRQVATVIDSGGVQDTSPNIPTIADVKIYNGQLLTVNPNGGAAWTAAAVNALKLGPKVAV